jgi:predicted CXXCH cytochrome family protein
MELLMVARLIRASGERRGRSDQDAAPRRGYTLPRQVSRKEVANLRRLALLFGGGVVFLLFGALPVLADGGPHVAAINNGSTGITADGCAGCHRAHTAQGAGLLVTSEENLCLFCHGASGTGATTDVATGLQYKLGTGGQGRGAVLGALRGGGFLEASIGSNDSYRVLKYYVSYPYTPGIPASSPTDARIPVASEPSAATSAHIALEGVGFTNTETAWGNGAVGTGAGPEFTGGLTCTSCHNPHGNGNYRILNGIPQDSDNSLTSATGGSISAVNVTDDTTNSGTGDETRNYTVIQVKPGAATANGAAISSDYLLTAQSVSALADANGNYGPLSGDYLHKYAQYNVTSGNDAPNGQPTTFYAQMTAWCETCHTRYDANHQTTTDTGDDPFNYKHTSNANSRYCLTCHVSHGSNAVMNQDTSLGTTYSANILQPDGSASHVGDSRLLKVDNRGTCLLCHDPTVGSAFPSYPNVPDGALLPQGTAPTLFP